ncbi:dynamin family protein [Paenibacillus sp. PL91]|uniref:dynamin family protein n=1 Tax=Paenibacillus sp. PL91 TaxID=2729538 RepID=UPI00145D1B5C|nr:dynamin family protein [Paenibacillus sp. PL91]MBC9203658.1 dynamin family protein [Paenibacillus sp. PL91]
MLEKFAETKKMLLNFNNELQQSEYIDRYIIEHSMLADEMVRLEEGEFKIALVAPFSAGKSTFINSIIGKDLLSMDIRAETSVITKISYSEDIKVEITYFDQEKTEMIATDPQGMPLTYDSCRELLEKTTTVRDSKNEEMIKQVIVYCPLEICKDKVVIIDTPGLFSRHEKHEAITNNVLPQVNAIIFMISPDSVGNEHFTEKIKKYVESAKSSSLEVDGGHIFFVINKIDYFNRADIVKARHELEVVLSGIIMNPKIYEMSAYYGMKGKQLRSGDIEIKSVQTDHTFKIPDPEEPEYMIAGRQITPGHVDDILAYSRINELESSLGEYLQAKNDYLIKDAVSSMRTVLSDTVNKLRFEMKELQLTIKEDNSAYIQKIDKLRKEIEDVRDETLNSVNDLISKRMIGDLSGGLEDEIADEIRGDLVDITKDIDRDLYKKWTKAKQGIDRYNAEDVLQNVIMDAEDFLVLKVKEMVRKSFLSIKKIVSALIHDIQLQLDNVAVKLEEVELKNLGSKMNRIGNLNVESLVGSTMNQIEREFSTSIVSIAKDCKKKVENAYKASISTIKKAGVWNWLKGLVGMEDYEERFDSIRFKRELDVIIDELTETMKDKLLESDVAITQPIFDMTSDIVDKMNAEVMKIISNVVKIKENVLLHLKKEMDKNEEQKEASILDMQQRAARIKEMRNRFEEKLARQAEEAETDGLLYEKTVYQ